MTNSKILTLFFILAFSNSFCQKLDSVLIDKNLKNELLGDIKPIEWVTEGRMDFDEYYTFFTPIYLNNDTHIMV